ncbi:hypothetical protein [Lacticaseibacillus daqingensis]|uniref:hypothetical protein n=1 Tax=Lacticaseibacillus daqingensis TaxID=2486014 RepID=UPI000F7A2923|nr:hypothetical protein [Lacticaseibacillus daqingensis]
MTVLRFEWRRLWASRLAWGLALTLVLLCGAVFGLTTVRQAQLRHTMQAALTARQKGLAVQTAMWRELPPTVRDPAMQAAAQLQTQLTRQQRALRQRNNRAFLQARIRQAELELSPVPVALREVVGIGNLKAVVPAATQTQLRQDRACLQQGLGIEQSGSATRAPNFVVDWLTLLATPLASTIAVLLVISAWGFPQLSPQHDWMQLNLPNRWGWPVTHWLAVMGLWLLLLGLSLGVAMGLALGLGQPLIGGTAGWLTHAPGEVAPLLQLVSELGRSLVTFGCGAALMMGLVAFGAHWRRG